MDSIKMQKNQAMRNYKKKAQFFLIKVVVYSLAAILSSLFYLFLFWFPTMNHFISMYLLPNIYSLFINSRFLFILIIIIVAILIVDSKLPTSCNPISSTDENYNNYVEKNQSVKLIKKQHRDALSLMPSTNNINKNVTEEPVMVHDHVLHPLKTVTSCSIVHDVTDPKNSMGTRTQGQRKKLKKHVHKKTRTSTRDDREYECNTISSGRELVTRDDHEDGCTTISGGELVTLGGHEDDCKTISGGEIVEFVDKVIIDVELQASNEGGKCHEREEEKIDHVQHDIIQKNELNRRADEFIARVNRRRMLEREAWAELHRDNGVSVSS